MQGAGIANPDRVFRPRAAGLTMKMKKLRLLWAVLIIAVIAGGCSLVVRRPSIAELQYNSGRYYDKRVAVEGEVTSSWGVPLLPYGVYKVSDGTGEVTVLGRGGRTPARGARVRVTGKVSELAVLGGRSLGLHIREDDLDFRRR